MNYHLSDLSVSTQLNKTFVLEPCMSSCTLTEHVIVRVLEIELGSFASTEPASAAASGSRILKFDFHVGLQCSTIHFWVKEVGPHQY